MVSLLGFFAPLNAISPVVLIEWSIYKLIPIILILKVLLGISSGGGKKVEFRGYVYLLLLYMFLISVFRSLEAQFSPIEYFETIAERSFLRTYGHMVVQFITMTLLVFFFLIPQKFPSVEFKYLEFVNGFLLGVFFSSLAGIFSYSLALAGFDLLGRLGVESYEVSRLRVAGLSGEPRHLGALIVAALMIFSIEARCWARITFFRRLIFLGTLLLSLFGTLSTSAWGAGTLAIVGAMFVPKHGRPAVGVLSRRKALFFIGFLLIVINLLFFSSSVQERVVKRLVSLDTMLYFIPKEALILSYIRQNPFYGLFGAGAGGMDSRIHAEIDRLEIGDNVAVSGIVKSVQMGGFESSLTASGFLPRWLSDFGLIGVVILALLLMKMVLKVRDKEARRRLKALAFMTLPASAVMSSIAVFILLYIFAFAFADARRRENFIKGKVLRSGGNLIFNKNLSIAPYGALNLEFQRKHL